jgi:putative protease
MNPSQLSPALAKLKPYMVYVPLEGIGGTIEKLRPFMEDGDIKIGVSLPRVISDDETAAVKKLMDRARNAGISHALVSNLGQIMSARSAGFKVHGDFGLNIYNSTALGVVRDLGLDSATLSFEMRLEQARDISKVIDTELIVYGRLPLMLTENCIIKNSAGVCACNSPFGLKDRSGFILPVVREFGCRNVILNSKKLFLADRRKDFCSIGLWGARLNFTTENAAECVSVTSLYLGEGKFEPSSYTRGLYFRGVD